jgi:hypothetical protein
MDTWHELEMIAPQARAQTEVLSVLMSKHWMRLNGK